MMAVCPVCGKLKVIHWPEFWIYRRGNNYYCCENCMEIQMSKDLNLLHDVLRKRRKGALKMARMKKDGTPAKKPGPKNKTAEEIIQEIKEMPQVKIYSDELKKTDTVPEKKEETPVSNVIGYKVCAVEGEFGRFLYDKKHNAIDWTTPEGEEVSMDPVHWRILAKHIPRIVDILQVEASV